MLLGRVILLQASTIEASIYYGVNRPPAPVLIVTFYVVRGQLAATGEDARRFDHRAARLDGVA